MSDSAPTAFVLQPFGGQFDELYITIRRALERAGLAVLRADSELSGVDSILHALLERLSLADLIVADLSDANPSVMYELGFAQGQRKPVILITRALHEIPFDIASLRALVYRSDTPADLFDFEAMLTQVAQQALENPEAFSVGLDLRPASNVNRLFISYSHRDADMLDRLLVHLRPLERAGLLDAWNDTRIAAGADWKREIQNALRHARTAILLISADFLASDFVVSDELPELLRAAETRGTLILPIIVKPSRFARDPTLNRFQAVNRPEAPLIGLPEAERERIFDEVAQLCEGTTRH
jgi:TIR domain-containing protein